eukprot:tig00021721_g23217.t1
MAFAASFATIARCGGTFVNTTSLDAQQPGRSVACSSQQRPTRKFAAAVPLARTFYGTSVRHVNGHLTPLPAPLEARCGRSGSGMAASSLAVPRAKYLRAVYPCCGSASVYLAARAQIFELDAPEEYRAILKVAKESESLVIVWVSASFCRPCKGIAPKMARLAAERNELAFIKIVGDKNDGLRDLCRSLEIKSVPTFRFIVDGETVHEFSGAKFERVLEAINQYSAPQRAPVEA